MLWPTVSLSLNQYIWIVYLIIFMSEFQRLFSELCHKVCWRSTPGSFGFVLTLFDGAEESWRNWNTNTYRWRLLHLIIAKKALQSKRLNTHLELGFILRMLLIWLNLLIKRRKWFNVVNITLETTIPSSIFTLISTFRCTLLFICPIFYSK